MKIKLIIIWIICMIILTEVGAANSPYGKMDVYYNDKLLPGAEVAKPILKIAEPFNIKINTTVNREFKVSGKLTELGEGYFEVIDGPSKMDKYASTILKANESHIFEWTVIPTDKWAGGSLPINFHYSIVEKGNPEPVLNSEFTVAYCTILNEHYEGKVPTPTTSENSTSPKSAKPPESTPAFTAIGTLLSGILALALFRR